MGGSKKTCQSTRKRETIKMVNKRKVLACKEKGAGSQAGALADRKFSVFAGGVTLGRREEGMTGGGPLSK